MIKRRLTALKKACKDFDLHDSVIPYDEIIDYLKNTKGKINYKLLYKVLKNETEYFNIYDRMDKISRLGKDSSSYKSFIIRYGKKVGSDLYEKKRKSVGTSKNDYIKKFGAEKFYFDRGSNNDKNRKIRYGKEWKSVKEEYLSKFKKSHSIEGYIEKYGKEEGTKLFNEKINKYKKYNSLDGYIERHGKKKGTKIFNEKYENVKYKNSLEYYIDTYGEEEGYKIMRKVKDNTSKRSFIERHGETEGTILYNKHCELMSRVAVEFNFADNFKNSRGISNGSYMASKISNSIIDTILEIIENNNIHFNRILYNNDELKITHDNRNFYYDFCIDKKIIEIHGEFWHGSPALFEENDIHPIIKKKILEIHKDDEYKHNVARNEGYNVLVVWTNEFKDIEKFKDKILTYIQ